MSDRTWEFVCATIEFLAVIGFFAALLALGHFIEVRL